MNLLKGCDPTKPFYILKSKKKRCNTSRNIFHRQQTKLPNKCKENEYLKLPTTVDKESLGCDPFWNVTSTKKI